MNVVFAMSDKSPLCSAKMRIFNFFATALLTRFCVTGDSAVKRNLLAKLLASCQLSSQKKSLNWKCIAAATVFNMSTLPEVPPATGAPMVHE